MGVCAHAHVHVCARVHLCWYLQSPDALDLDLQVVGSMGVGDPTQSCVVAISQSVTHVSSSLEVH